MAGIKQLILFVLIVCPRHWGDYQELRWILVPCIGDLKFLILWEMRDYEERVQAAMNGIREKRKRPMMKVYTRHSLSCYNFGFRTHLYVVL